MADEIIKVEDTKIANVTTDSISFNIPEGYINTIDMTTNEGKKKAVKALNDAKSLNDYVGVELKICDCITMPGVRKGRNGMPDMQCKNTILIDIDGTSYFTQSDGIARSITMYSAIWPDFGKESTAEGYLSLCVKEQELNNGNSLKTIVPFEG